MARDAKQAGSSLKTKKPQCGNTEASGNEINFEEEIVMADNSTAVPGVIPFDFRGDSVRAVSIEGEPWFVAADVCRVLDVVNTTQAMQSLDEDERSMFNIGRQGQANVVNESGLYTLILRCRDAVKKGSKPHAFRKWVTAEVLPAIRKHGHFVDGNGAMEPMLDDLLGKSGALRLSNVMRCRVAKMDSEHQRSATAKLASALHACFGVTRIELIPSSQFEAAANFIASYAIEGEYIPKALPTPSLNIHCPIEMLASRREGMLKIRNRDQAWLDVTLHDLREIQGEGTPLEKLLWELESAGFDIRGAWWELRTYRNKLREIASVVTGLGRVMEDSQRYAVDTPKGRAAA